MGAGLAKQAALRFPTLPKLLAAKIMKEGNRVFAFRSLQIITFPVKEHWRDNASLDLIENSRVQLEKIVTDMGLRAVFLPRVGCGNGRLRWETVKTIMEKLDDRFIVVSYDERGG